MQKLSGQFYACSYFGSCELQDRMKERMYAPFVTRPRELLLYLSDSEDDTKGGMLRTIAGSFGTFWNWFKPKIQLWSSQDNIHWFLCRNVQGPARRAEGIVQMPVVTQRCSDELFLVD